MIKNNNILEENNQLLKHLVALVEGSCQSTNDAILPDHTTNPPLKIANGEIGTFAEVIWAILELGLITQVDENGKEHLITNKEKAAEEICKRLFGEPIKKWDQTIRAAFDRDKALDIFRKMTIVAQDKKNNMR
jgi:hypothetical protein